MGSIAWVIVALIGLYVARLLIQNNHMPRRVGVVDGHLAPLDGKRNAVSSDTDLEPMSVALWPFKGDRDATRIALRKAILAHGGAEIVTDNPGYLHAVFTTQGLHFHDDVEFMLDGSSLQTGTQLLSDPADWKVHIRSQSRAGRFDYGVNRKRIDRLSELYNAG